MSYEVLGLGSACIDLLVSVEHEFLDHVPGQKGGAEPIDFENLNRIIQAAEQKPRMATGGSCANAIKGLTHLGVKCALLSKIGSDPLGHYFTDSMVKLGITPLFISSSSPTTRVLCLITPDGQRTMRFFAGSSSEMSDHHLEPSYIKGVRLVHMDAYSLYNGHLVEKMADMAKQANLLLSMDLSSFEIVHTFKDRMINLLTNKIDLVFANADEVQALTGLPPEEGCLKIQKWGLICVTLIGKEGCLVGHKDRVTHYPTSPACVVDTTGAGDLFASGFLYGYLRQLSLDQCAYFGNLLGGAVTEVTGTEMSTQKWKALRQEIASKLDFD